MSWMKNMWNKMFTEETEADEKIVRQSEETISVPEAQKPQGKPAPFRFPLISDEEAKGMPPSEPPVRKPEPKKAEETVLKEQDRYELEALEPSGKLPKPNPSRNKKKRPYGPKTKEPSSLDLPVNTTRRFQPTRVASPVHGFTDRPAPIDQLLERDAEKKKAELESRYDWSQRSLQELYKTSGQMQTPADAPVKAEVSVYRPVTEPEETSLSENTGPIDDRGEAPTEEAKPEPKYEWADRSLQDLLPKNQPAHKQPTEPEVTIYHSKPAAPEAAAETVQPVPREKNLGESAGITETKVFHSSSEREATVQQDGEIETVQPVQEEIKDVEEPLAKTEAKVFHSNTEPSSAPVQQQEEEDFGKGQLAARQTVETPAPQVLSADKQQEQVHKQEPPELLPKAKNAIEGKKEKTVPFNVLMLKSDKQRSTSRIEPSTEKKTAIIEPAEEKPESQAVNAGSPVPYELPAAEFLLAPEDDLKDEEWMAEQGDRLIEALSHFQIKANIVGTVQGPAVTRFELRVAQGIKVSKIRNLADDLKLALAARDIRIQAPIPGKSSIGIEIPNRQSRAVRISEVIGSPAFLASPSPLEAALGLDLAGNPVTLDLRKMPHGLIAGATGSGKSVCINSLLVSLLYKSAPKDLKMLLIDPKMVELAPYNHIPHLISPVITDVKAATASLKWAVEEMERRYQLFAHVGVRDLDRYNKSVHDKGQPAQHLPYILIVIDELADLMMMSPSDVEDSICRIAQKARACGIHLVIATQRPSVDVITGLIKSNIPTRIAFSVSSQVDSRTILDTQGAERLLGRGDMLYLGNGMAAPSRLQGTFVTDDEIEKVIAHARTQGEPDYVFKEEELIQKSHSPAEQDDLFEEACRFIMSQGSASTSLLQRKFHIGYNRAARLMDLIEEHGFISEQNGSKARTVLLTEADIEEVFR